jgi:minor extracellular serine protease Vpr
LGVAALDNGLVIAQHGVGSADITEASPAKQGEVVVIYLSGMGATNPAVKSGQAAPGGPNLAKAVVQPTVTLNGQAATVQFAGLTPGFVGLYQVNFVVPNNAGTGDLTLIVKQNNVSSNATRIPVSK